MGTLDLILKLMSVLGAALNILDSTGAVSKIIGGHIAAGTTEWSDSERAEIRRQAMEAKAKADADITAAGG